jgi:hypothetical protein
LTTANPVFVLSYTDRGAYAPTPTTLGIYASRQAAEDEQVRLAVADGSVYGSYAVEEVIPQ